LTGLVLPRHVHHAVAARRANAAADALAQRPQTVYRIDSDDFVTPKDVMVQLTQLQEYICERRVAEGSEAYRLPEPSGWKLSLLVLTVPGESAGGVIISDDHRESRALASPQGVVLALGPSAYTDPSRFSLGDKLVPWHKVGDRITFVKYDASMFQLPNGQRLGFLNDTQPVSCIDRGWQVPS
jgi:co-chaperonin GroES (HSP10)